MLYALMERIGLIPKKPTHAELDAHAATITPSGLTEGYVVKGGTNDLSRWEQFGGTLKRPPPPAPMNVRETARRNGLWTLPPVTAPMPPVRPTLGPRPPATNPLSCCPECGRRLTRDLFEA